MEYKGFDKNFGLSGKIALVTGSAKGIGKAVAMLFAEKGADIILVDMDESVKVAAEEITRLGRKALPLVYDISKSANIPKLVSEGLDKFGRIDILVNSAGVALLDDAENITEEMWDKTISINLKAIFMLSQAVGKEMIKNKKGKIINIASIAGPIAFDKHTAYTVKQGRCDRYDNEYGNRVGKVGINVNSISPIVTLTEMGRTVWVGEIGEATKKVIPIGRFNEPDEIAAVAVFLASDATDMITGQNIVIDGGYSIK